jgi:3-oxoacyl-[acyl-carrier protein] reductase
MRSVLVTGAARGLGEAIAGRLHRGGYAVVLADLDGDAVRRGSADLGSNASPLRLDVRSAEAWRDAAEVLGRAGAPWGLVNCAARTIVRPFLEIEPDEWDDVLAVNLRGPFLGMQAIGPLLQRAGGGRIVNISSDAAFKGVGVTGAHYATSKAGLLTLTRRAAAAFGAGGVTVNAIAPGTVDGATVRELAGDRLDELAAASPLGRLASPNEVASLVAWLLGEDGGYTTGAVFVMDGGASL